MKFIKNINELSNSFNDSLEECFSEFIRDGHNFTKERSEYYYMSIKGPEQLLSTSTSNLDNLKHDIEWLSTTTNSVQKCIDKLKLHFSDIKYSSIIRVDDEDKLCLSIIISQ